MKRILAFFLILCFAVPLMAQENVYFNGSFDGAKDAAKNSGKQLVIFFYSNT